VDGAVPVIEQRYHPFAYAVIVAEPDPITLIVPVARLKDARAAKAVFAFMYKFRLVDFAKTETVYTVDAVKLILGKLTR
jgi:hypothetical protein